MLVILDKADNILDKLSILLEAFFLAGFLGILLQSPDSPQWYVRLLYLSNMNTDRLAFHKLVISLHGSLHHQFEVVIFLDREGETRKSDECIAGTALEPRVTCQDITVIVLFTTMELMSRIDQTVEEIVTRRALIHFLVEELLQADRLDF